MIMDNNFYNSEFEDKLFKTIELVRQDNNNKNLLISLFEKDFASNKATLFEMFKVGEDGSSILSAEQQKVLFDNLLTLIIPKQLR